MLLLHLHISSAHKVSAAVASHLPLVQSGRAVLHLWLHWMQCMLMWQACVQSAVCLCVAGV